MLNRLCRVSSNAIEDGARSSRCNQALAFGGVSINKSPRMILLQFVNCS